jgi:hypothetical protein
LAQSANPFIGKWKVTWQKDGVDRQASLVIEESWSSAPVQANTAMLQPLLDGALQEWLQRLKKVSEAGKSQ